MSTLAYRLNLILIVVLILACLSLISGCNSFPSSKSQLSTEKSEETHLTVMPTLLYVPKPPVTKEEGVNPLPYVSSENPYEQQRGRLNKESIQTFIQAKSAFKKGNINQAKALLESLTESNRRLSGPWVLLGDIARQQQEYRLAEKHYEKAIEINKVNINAYLRLALVLRSSGQYIKAQNIYAEALALWPDFPEAHLNLGILYDLYLNNPINAQRHMEAYQFLTAYKSKQVEEWITELQSRTLANRALMPKEKSVVVNR